MGPPARPAAPAWAHYRLPNAPLSRDPDVSRSPRPKRQADIPTALMGGSSSSWAPARPKGPMPPPGPPPC
eukprot:14083935-Heterocapsa_arctica.AAC.1